MALIDKIKAIADAIRSKTGYTELLSLDEMPDMIERIEGNSGSIDTLDNTYILVDENGYEIPAVLTDEEVVLTAGVNDIRIGLTAVTDDGVVIGEKEIPVYYVTEGTRKISVGSNFNIRIPQGRHRYTKLQLLLCAFNGTINASVSTDRVGIGESMYMVNSSVPISTITIDDISETIELGLTNDSDIPYVIRYFTYKEEQ